MNSKNSFIICFNKLQLVTKISITNQLFIIFSVNVVYIDIKKNVQQEIEREKKQKTQRW